MAKSTEAEIDQRVNQTYLLLLRREGRQTILQYAANKWGVGSRTADEYIARARELMREEASAERDDALAEHIALRKDLFNKAYKDKKWAIAFQICQDESKLLGLYFNLEDHLRAVVSAGYRVAAPGSPEEQEIVQGDADLDYEVEIEEALPTDDETLSAA